MPGLSKGHLPLSPVDTDARWLTSSAGKPPELDCQDNAIVDRGRFILSRGVTHASEGEWKALPRLLEHLPLPPSSLAADTACNAGRLRQTLEERGITAYIPIHPRQESNMVARGGFEYWGDHVVCPQGKVLRRAGYHRRNASYQYVASQKDCQACPSKNSVFPLTRSAGIWDSPSITRCTFKPRNGTKLPAIGEKWRGVGPLSRESLRRLTGWDGQSRG